MQPLVSILIPAFNAADSIGETIESAVGQTWPCTEIIVVDDGSTDGTAAIARRFPGVRVIFQPNQGAPAARNKAFSLSRGDYIQWLDADDILAPQKIARQMAVLTNCGKRTVASGPDGVFFYRIDKAQFRRTLLWCDLSALEFITRNKETGAWFPPFCWLTSRELTESAGPWDERLRCDQDGEFFCRVILASDGVRFVPDARGYYRMRGMNGVHYTGFSSHQLESRALSARLHVEHVLAIANTERIRRALVADLQSNLVLYHTERPDLIEQLQRLAQGLGGDLQRPQLRWKFRWLQFLFGWRAARRAQLLYPELKGALRRRWARLLHRQQQCDPQFAPPRRCEGCQNLWWRIYGYKMWGWNCQETGGRAVGSCPITRSRAPFRHRVPQLQRR